MGKSAELFLQIQEELVNTHTQVQEGELSNLDGLIAMRKAKAEAEKVLEIVSNFESERQNEIVNEAVNYPEGYCGYKVSLVNGRKLFSFKGIAEVEELEKQAKAEKDRFQTAFESFQKGLIQTSEVDGVLYWIDDNGELHKFPEMNVGKSYLKVEQTKSKK